MGSRAGPRTDPPEEAWEGGTGYSGRWPGGGGGAIPWGRTEACARGHTGSRARWRGPRAPHSCWASQSTHSTTLQASLPPCVLVCVYEAVMSAHKQRRRGAVQMCEERQKAPVRSPRRSAVARPRLWRHSMTPRENIYSGGPQGCSGRHLKHGHLQTAPGPQLENAAEETVLYN